MVVPGLRNENKRQENQANDGSSPATPAALGIANQEDHELSEIQEKETINEADTVQNENVSGSDEAGLGTGANKHF